MLKRGMLMNAHVKIGPKGGYGPIETIDETIEDREKKSA
jgi:hypothetical protein